MACAQNKSQPAKAAQQEQNIKQVKEKNMGVQNLTAALFKQNIMDYEKHPNDWVFQGERPVVIDFFATWCGPCKATAPIVEELAKEYAGKIDFYKVDVDQEEELAALFGIRSIYYTLMMVLIYCLCFFTLESFNFFNWLQWIENVGGSMAITSVLIITIEMFRSR